jgi:hypothetical protein
MTEVVRGFIQALITNSSFTLFFILTLHAPYGNKEKGKVVRVLKYHAEKTYEGVEVKLHSFSTAVVDGREWPSP